MSGCQLPVQYHDVVGVAVIIGDEGFQPQEVFRYPFFNEDPYRGSLGHFDRVPPGILTKLLKTDSGEASGMLLEMVFDDVRIISRPVQLRPERGDKERTAVFFSLVFVVASEYYPPRQLYPPTQLPKHPRKKKPPLPSLPSGVPGSTPIATSSRVPGGAGTGAGEDAEAKGGKGSGEPGDTDTVEVVEVEDEEGEDEDGSRWKDVVAGGGGDKEEEEERGPGIDLSLLRGALMMVSRAMSHEERKNGYVSRAGKQLQIKKENRASETEKIVSDMTSVPLYRDKGADTGVYMNFGGRLYGGARQYSPDEMKARGDERWQESVMDDSQLARDMRTLYQGLTGGEPFEMSIKSDRASALSINVTVQREIPAARRFETLLLREQKHIALAGHRSLKGGSPQIRRLIEMADPHKTLEELAYGSEIELSQMLRLARHMVFWGDGRVIDTLCGSNRYQVTREAMKAVLPSSPLLAEFRGRFPRRNLMQELTRFGEMRPLAQILEQSNKSTHEALIAVLTLLLRRDLLVQVHRFVTLAIPPPYSDGTNGDCEDNLGGDFDNGDHDKDKDNGMNNTDGDDDDDHGCDDYESDHDDTDVVNTGELRADINSSSTSSPDGGSGAGAALGGNGGSDSATRVGCGGGSSVWSGRDERGGASGGSECNNNRCSVTAAAAAANWRRRSTGDGDGDGGGGHGGGRGGGRGGGSVGGSSFTSSRSSRGRSPKVTPVAHGKSGLSPASAAPAASAISAAAGGTRTGRGSSGNGSRNGGGGSFRGTFPGTITGSVVGYAVDAAGNTLFEAPTLQPFEEDYLQRRDDGSEVSRLMRRLAPLLRGKLSMREIIWRLEITDMRLLEEVLEAYGDVLHEVLRPARDPDPGNGV